MVENADMKCCDPNKESCNCNSIKNQDYQEPNIRLIDANTDLSNIDDMGWDLEIKEIPWTIYRIDGYYHTIGGRYGNNCYWCCPTNEEASYQNLIAFDGEAPTWGIKFERSLYFKTKWSETRLNSSGTWTITRNGKDFYSDRCRDMEYGLACAQIALVKLQEHPIPFHFRNWQKEVIGRKIFYYNEPAIITSIVRNQGCIMIVPDKDCIEYFSRKPWDCEENECGGDWYDEFKDGCKVEFLSEHIWWFRK